MKGKENEPSTMRLPSDAYNLGDELLSKARESVEKQSVLPLLKDELRLKIQTRRLSQGLDELKVDFQIKPPTPLTPNEIEKQKYRKINNRASACKCRIKKKQFHAVMEQELRRLEEENRRLKEKICNIEIEKEYYISNIVKHPVITKVLAEFSDMNLTTNKNEIVYQQN